MTMFWQGISLCMVGAILFVVVGKNSSEVSTLLVLGAVCAVSILSLNYLKPVLQLFDRLQDMSQLSDESLGILIRAIGIGLITEFAGLICSDAGNASLAKTVRILGGTTMLWLSIPMIEQLLDLIENVMGNV